MVKTVFVSLILLVLSQVCLAKLTRSNTQPVTFPVSAEQQEDNKITQKDVEKVIPTDLQQTNDMTRVAVRIADRSIQSWFNSAAVQSSVVGQAATKVQKTMATDITVKSEEPQAVEHKFSLQVLALQAMAKVQYTGWLNAVFNYDVKAAESMIQFSEKVFNKDLFVNHTSSASKGEVSSVGIRWGW